MSVLAEQQSKRLGLIGLGLVGTSLARRFLDAGFHVIGYDIDPSRRALEPHGVEIAESVTQVAESSERIVLSLPDSVCVKDVLFGGRGFGTERLSHKLIIDSTTGDPLVTTQIAHDVENAGGAYVDACIIGSSKQVLLGGVIVSAGGHAKDMDRCTDVFATFAERVFHMGEPGKGSQAKLAANLVLGLNRLVLSEGLLFAESMGLEPQSVLELMKAGAAYSRVMDAKGEKMITQDFEPQARLAQHLKDVNLMLQTAERCGAHLILAEIHQRLLQRGIEMGKGDLDNSAIIEVLREAMGVHEGK